MEKRQKSLLLLLLFSKLCFLNSIKQNVITSNIFSGLLVAARSNRSKSFLQDIKVLEKRFNYGIEDIYLNSLSYKKLLKESFNLRDGIADSINICLSNFKSKIFKNMLNNLIKPEFIREDEDFQELLQYLIITDEYS